MLTEKDHCDFLFRDYELKVNFLNQHFSRLWTRFNFFLTIELALFGFLGYVLFDPEVGSYEATIFPILLGIGVSGLWAFVGWQDRALVKVYQTAIEDAAKKIAGFKEFENYKENYVGKKVNIEGPIQYVESFSITKLPLFLGLFTSFIWFVMLYMRCAKSAPFDIL